MSIVTGGKGCLFIAAIVAGSGSGFAIFSASHQIFPSLFLGLGLALIYTVTAAWIVGICETLARLAFPDDQVSWSIDTKAYLGAFWPLSFLFWVVVTPFFAIINRLFR